MRNKLTYLGGASALAMLAMGGAAQAQSQTETAAPAVTVSAEQLQQMQADIAALRQQLSAVEARAAAAEAKAAEASSDGIKWKGAPQFSGSDGFTFKPRGRLQYDFAHVGKPDNYGTDKGLGFSNELRRGRIGMQGDIPGGFGYKLELDFADNGVAFADAFLSYEDGDVEVIVGQHNNFQSMNEITSSLDTSFMERAAFTDAFGFERRIGISAQYSPGDILAQVGVFTDDIGGVSNDENDTIGVSGRLVYAPKLGENTQLHLAGSAHYRDLGDTTPTLRLRQRPMLHTSDTRFIDTGAFAADSETNYGLEAAAINGPFHIAGEAHWQNANLTGVSEDAGFFGGYVEAGYFLTGESRGYKGGVFKGPKVKNPVNEGGSGAFQLVARYDYLDLNDADVAIIGGKQNAYELSAIWWPTNYVRFMANYGHLEYDDAAATLSGDTSYGIDVFGARAQISF